MKQAFPRHQEPPELIAALAGLTATTPPQQLPAGQGLQGGLSAGEALVFWLGGFSSDPKYPISGDGGPAYRIQSLGNAVNRTLDPIESRNWIFPFQVGRLGLRDDEGFFPAPDDADKDLAAVGKRYIEYPVTINGQPQFRRINFWQYAPRKSRESYLYFDTSRHPPTAAFDPPAATELSGLGIDVDNDGIPDGLHVHAFKTKSDSPSAVPPIQYINPDKFQILHCGDDDSWDDVDPSTDQFVNFERMSAHFVTNPNNFLLFPDGPFIGEIADTIVNFTTETKIEDAQP
jgi:hypothetical protein